MYNLEVCFVSPALNSSDSKPGIFMLPLSCTADCPAAVVVVAGCSAELIGKFAAYVADDYSDKIIDEAPLFLNEKHIADTVLQMDNCGYSDELRRI